ncbi:hypothetical protein [Rubellimicrobium arenae]|uniref:hypothetical protein n=1 Tax=Rubellimicrobium arenae TaxID=2817372 RepID=UPI001B318778|nr:hypothetical protein [Rubellimicrobium arenae]
MGRIAAIALCAALTAGGALRAESAFDLVFRTGTLDGLSQGTRLTYEGEGPAEAPPGEDWREIVVGLQPDGSAMVEGRREGGGDAAQPLGRFNAATGNPIAMLFLEQTVRRIAEATGGSPFYIRNRIRDSLAGTGRIEDVTVDWDGGPIPATEVVLLPFAEDAHRAELGPFADLEIHVVVSESVPGWYHSIRTESGAAGAEPVDQTSLTLAGITP